jgi:hypothetical protein
MPEAMHASSSTAAIMALYDREPSAKQFCQPVGGMNARDQRSSDWQPGVKHNDRITADRDPRKIVRAKSSVSLCAGRASVIGIAPDRSRTIRPKVMGKGSKIGQTSAAEVFADVAANGYKIPGTTRTR